MQEQISIIYNEGERLVPGETHDGAELVRHKSTYKLYYDVILLDLILGGPEFNRPFTILDVGSGVGHGVADLAEIPFARVIGLEPSPESVEYSQAHYAGDNIEYILGDLESFTPPPEGFDYVVSRGALEHIPDGLNAILKIPFSRRLFSSVPYLEKEGNPHHLIHQIDETSFENYASPVFAYETLHGVTDLSPSSAGDTNIITGIASQPGLPDSIGALSFPRAAWAPNRLESMALSAAFPQRARRAKSANPLKGTAIERWWTETVRGKARN